MKLGMRTQRAAALVMAAAVLAASLGGCAALAAAPAEADTAKAQAAPEQTAPVADGKQSEMAAKKSETVYVNLDANGKAYETTVTDWLHNDKAGGQFKDRSDLTNIVNIKGEEAPVVGPEGITWDMSGSDLYYQGTSSKELPLDVEIRYTLDGVEMAPQDMAGKSGHVQITLNFRNKAKHTVTVAGKQAEMYTPLTVAAGMTLDSDVFSNVAVSDGTVLSDGNNQAVAFVCVPGLRDSLALGSYSVKELNDLDFPEEFTVDADATDFEMGPIMIAMSPQLPDLDDLKKSDDFDDMKQDMYDLRGMQDDLNTMDPDRDIRSLITDPNRTEGARTIIDDVFDFYDLNKDIMDILPKYVTKQNINLYDRFKYDLKDSTVNTLLDKDNMDELVNLTDEIQVARLNELVDTYQNLQKNKQLTAALKQMRPFLLSAPAYQLATAGVSAVQLAASHSEEVKTLLTVAGYTKELGALIQDVKAASKVADESMLRDLVLTNIRSMLLPEANGAISYANAKALLAMNPEDESWKKLIGILNTSDATGTSSIEELLQELAEEQKQAADTVTGPAPLPDQTGDVQDPAQKEDASSTDQKQEGAGEQATSSEPEKIPEANRQPSESSADEQPVTLVAAAFVENSASDAAGASQPEASQPEASQPEASQPEASQPSKEESAPTETTEEPTKDANREAQAKQAETLRRVAAKMEERADGKNGARAAVLEALTQKVNGMTMTELAGMMKQQDARFAPLLDAMTHFQELQGKLEAAGVTDEMLLKAISFAGDEKTVAALETLLAAKQDCEPQLTELLTMLEQNPELVKQIQAMLPELLDNVELNRDNIETMRLLLNKLDETGLIKQVRHLDDLRDDVNDLEPIVKALRRDLDRVSINTSMHDSPHTVNVLMRMKDDLERWRNISETMRKMLLPENVELSRGMISTLDRLEAKGSADNGIEKLEDLDELLARKDQYVELSDQYTIFTDAPEGLETEVKFVMKTDEVKRPEPVEETAAPVEDTGFFTWIKSLVGIKENA